MARFTLAIFGTAVAGLVLLAVWRFSAHQEVSVAPLPGAAPETASEISVMRIPTEGMSCASCASKVKRRLHEFTNVVGVDVDLAKREVRISHTGALSREAAMFSIRELGYTPKAPDGEERTRNVLP